MKQRLLTAAWAEFAGTAMLLCAVIGSGIMAERLSNGNLAIALLANTLATVAAKPTRRRQVRADKFQAAGPAPSLCPD